MIDELVSGVDFRIEGDRMTKEINFYLEGEKTLTLVSGLPSYTNFGRLVLGLTRAYNVGCFVEKQKVKRFFIDYLQEKR